MKTVITAIALTFVATAAFADSRSNVVHEEHVYSEKPIYESVQVCEKVKDRTTEGAIIGGLLGSKDGNALGGAIIGGILGDLAGGHTKCKTETRKVGVERIYSHTMITVEIDGKRYTFRK